MSDPLLYNCQGQVDMSPRAVKLTKRQLEILTQCAGPHGMRDYTRYETAILNRLYENGLALRSCNGTDKWHATRAGRAALALTSRDLLQERQSHE